VPLATAICNVEEASDRRATLVIHKKNQKVPMPHDATLYRQRHKIDNMFGKLKDWRRITSATTTFMSAICIAAAVIFWLDQ
jgi:transposase